MSLGGDLAEAVQEAARRREESLLVKDKEIVVRRTVLQHESEAEPEDLKIRRDSLGREIGDFEPEVQVLEQEVARDREALSCALGQFRESLLCRCREAIGSIQEDGIVRDFLAALESFDVELTSLQIAPEQMSQAQKEAVLARLAEPANHTRTRALKAAAEASQKFSQHGDRLLLHQHLEEEKTRLDQEEELILHRLRAHSVQDSPLAPLAQSMVDADPRALSSLRRYTLEPTLEDLRIERANGLALSPEKDPLYILKLEMGRPIP